MSGVGRQIQPAGNEDLGGKFAALEQKVKDMEEHMAEAASNLERGKVAELERKVKSLEDHLKIGASGNAGDPELGEVEEPARKSSAQLNQEADEGFYELGLSMWDAGLLLVLNKNSLFDKVVLVVGMLLNMGLQLLLISLIVHTLLDNDFSRSTVEEMMAWRVDYGHITTEFDVAAGESKARKLCQHDSWSYEGNAYEEMYAYLYRAIPGWVLTALAITLWVLATMTELKKAVSQCLSLVNLAGTQYHERCITEEAGGNLVICGISAPARIAALFMIVLPRMIIAVCLMVVGSKYLSQTVTLNDIVLNTVGLAFVMDVDEHIAGVLLTERLQNIVQKIQPLSCGPPSTLWSRVRDMVRYAMIVFMIVFALSHWVAPFVSNVEAAATALCGGDLDFSFSGGTEVSPDITLRPTTIIFDEYQADCPTSANQTYLSAYYPQFNESGPMAVDGDGAGVGAATSRNWQQERMREVLRYAFSADECGDGRIRVPPKDTELTERTFFDMIFEEGSGGRKDHRGDFADGQCKGFPDGLRGALPDGVHPGGDPIVEECGRFDITLHEQACAEPAHPGVCRWSWEAERCEGADRPGGVFQSACRSASWQTCETWVRFNTTHPTMNCDEIVRHCAPESPRCLQMSGVFEFTFVIERFLGPNVGDLTVRETALREVISNAFRDAIRGTTGPDPWVAAQFYAFVKNTPCQCEAIWDFHDVCVNQAGCPVSACDGSGSPRCVVTNPGCQEDEWGTGWARCVPDCTSTDGDEATEFQCVCGDTTCEAGTSCAAENSTCREDTTGTTATTTTAPPCRDLDLDPLAVDGGGWPCFQYVDVSYRCGQFDTDLFDSRRLCCACGGGIVPACADPRDSCVFVLFDLVGISEDLRTAEVLAANESIAGYITSELSDPGSSWGLELYFNPNAESQNHVQVRFHEASVHVAPSAAVR